MRNIKSFNEMRNSNIHTGIELTQRQINYISDGIDKEYLEHFEILVDDGIFYVKLKYFGKFEFDRIQDLRDFIHLKYYMLMNKPDKVVEIIKRNKNLDNRANDNLIIRWSSMYGYKEIVRLLLQDDRVDPISCHNYSVKLAIKNGHIEIAKLLLADPRVDPSADDNYLILFASKYGYTEVAKLLLADPRVDPSANNNSAIKWATINKHKKVVKLLIKHPKVRETLTEKEIEEYENHPRI